MNNPTLFNHTRRAKFEQAKSTRGWGNKLSGVGASVVNTPKNAHVVGLASTTQKTDYVAHGNDAFATI
jgi:hypothetical protein